MILTGQRWNFDSSQERHARGASGPAIGDHDVALMMLPAGLAHASFACFQGRYAGPMEPRVNVFGAKSCPDLGHGIYWASPGRSEWDNTLPILVKCCPWCCGMIWLKLLASRLASTRQWP